MKFSIVLMICQLITAGAFTRSSTPSRLERNIISDPNILIESKVPNPVIKTAAKIMSIFKPVFSFEAQLQANALDIFRKIDRALLAEEILENKVKNDISIYTYGLSPFSKEALELLDSRGVEYRNIELGAEWFLLGAEASATRVLLSRELEVRSTSLPKIFIGGKCIGGCAELATMIESNEFDELMQEVKSRKK